jgi:subtilisin family serine protease
VIAVTAVDARHKALLEAARGRHVRFAAPGADMLAAGLTKDYVPVRGTSFAAPLVAGLIAQRIAAGDTLTGALTTLGQQARDLGRKGRDEVYGEGLLAEELIRPLSAATIK